MAALGFGRPICTLYEHGNSFLRMKTEPVHEHKRSALAVLDDTYQALVQFLAGSATADRKEWVLSIGYLLQRVRGGRFIATLLDEIKRYRDLGKIKDDYLSTEQGFTCMQELLDFIDKDSPDEVRFSAMKAIFLTAATESVSSRNDPVPQQIMQICRTLSSADLLILSATYEIANEVDWKQERPAGDLATQMWINRVLERTALRFPELVRLRERELVEKGILSRSLFSEGSGFVPTKHYRLTDLGYHICEFIKAYDLKAKPELSPN
jgi:hypothetical protein